MYYVYEVGLSWLLVYMIPLIILVTLNILLSLELRKAQARHAAMTHQEEDNNNMAVTLNIIVLVGVFILCQTPDFVLIVIFWDDIERDSTAVWKVHYIKATLLTLNSSVNFFDLFCVPQRFPPSPCQHVQVPRKSGK